MTLRHSARPEAQSREPERAEAQSRWSLQPV